MATERFDIQVSDNGTAKVVRRNIEDIAAGAKASSDRVEFLKAAIQGVGLAARNGVGPALEQLTLLQKQSMSAVQSLNAVKAAAGGAGGGAAAAGLAASRGAGGFNSMAGAVKGLISMVQLFIGLQIVKYFVGLADAYTMIQNRLRLYTADSANLNAVNEALYQSSQKTFSSYANGAKFYSMMALNQKALGASQKDLVTTTTAVQQSLQLSGANAQQSTTGMYQLGRGFAEARLRGREFFSIMHSMPVLAKEMADAEGTSVAGLQRMVAAGKVTGAMMERDILAKAPMIAQAFLTIHPTISMAMTELNNAMIHFVGNINNTLGISRTFADAMIWLSGHLEEVSIAAIFLATVAFGPALVDALLACTVGMLEFTAACLTNPFVLLAVAIPAAIAALLMFGNKVDVSGNGLINLRDITVGVFMTIWDVIQFVGHEVGALWSLVWDMPETKASGFVGFLRTAFTDILAFNKLTANGVIGGWRLVYDTIIDVFSNLPAAWDDLWRSAVNKAISHVNELLSALQLVAKLSTGDTLGAALMMKGDRGFQIPTVENKSQGTDAGIGARFGANAKRDFGQDYVGELGNAIGSAVLGNAMKAHNAPSSNPMGAVDDTETTPDPLLAPPGKGGHRRTYAEMLRATQMKLTDEDNRFTNPAVDFTNRTAYKTADTWMEGVHKDSLQKGFKAPGIAEQLKDYQLVLNHAKAVEHDGEVSAERDRIMKDSLEPQRAFDIAVEAANKTLAQFPEMAERISHLKLDAEIKRLSTNFDAASGAALGLLQIQKSQTEVTAAVASETKRLYDQYGSQAPLQTYMQGLTALNALKTQNLLTTQQLTKAEQELKISYLDTVNTAEAGMERAILKAQVAYNDIGKSVEGIFTGAFNDAESALTSFLDTGKLSLTKFFSDLKTNLDKMVVQNLVMSPIANMLGGMGIHVPGLGGPMGSQANPMFVKLVDGSTGDVIGGGQNMGLPISLPQLGVTGDSQSSMAASMANYNPTAANSNGGGMGLLGSLLGGGQGGGPFGGIGNQTGGLGGLMSFFQTGGSGFDIGDIFSLFGFSTGGAFTVGGSGGVDSQTVAFKASPGERVSIDRPGSSSSRQDASGGIVISVDARGAQQGVAEQISDALSEAIPRAIQQARGLANQDTANAFNRQSLPARRV